MVSIPRILCPIDGVRRRACAGRPVVTTLCPAAAPPGGGASRAVVVIAVAIGLLVAGCGVSHARPAVALDGVQKAQFGSGRTWNDLRVRAIPLRTKLGDEAWDGVLAMRPGRIIVSLPDGQQFEIATTTVTAIGYMRQEFRDAVLAGGGGLVPVPLPGRGAFGKSSMHLIAVEFSQANAAAGMLLEAKSGDYRDILESLVAETGVPVSVSAADRPGLPRSLRTKVVDRVPSGVLPDVPIWTVRRLAGHRQAVSGIAFSPDGSRIATSGEDHTLRVWAARTGEPDGLPIDLRERSAIGVAFTADGRGLFSWGYGRAEFVEWDIATRTTVFEGALPLRPDRVTIGSSRRFALTWGSAEPRPAAPLTSVSAVIDFERRRSVVLPAGAAFHFSGSGEVVIGVGSGRLTLWNPESGELMTDVPFPRTATASETGDAAMLLRAGGHLIMGASAFGAGALFRSAGNRPERMIVNRDETVAAILHSDRSVTLWDGKTLSRLGSPLLGHRGEIWDAAFSPDGTRLATVTPGHVVVWDVQTQHAIGQCDTGPVAHFGYWAARGRDGRTSIVFSPGGDRIGVIRDGDDSAAVCDVPAVP